ncbi:hypothetical protein [Brevibacillus sp. HD1.4A]|uniref:hypothetical protein n=1 Tax=Brevibacillus sp. HD1.4A TaxID=2738978 RepID=UPI00156BD756|nr:hypothetical protein [Brevibacillus sp. HD1.4A]NRQ51945.1 hypothetical protein [Brevibacillus sp. HD1.4A]
MRKVIVTLPPNYPVNDPNYPSKERLEMAYTVLLAAAERKLAAQQAAATKSQNTA